jgi:hypothetical protein
VAEHEGAKAKLLTPRTTNARIRFKNWHGVAAMCLDFQASLQTKQPRAAVSVQQKEASNYEYHQQQRGFLRGGGDRKSKSQPVTLIPKLSDLGVSKTQFGEELRKVPKATHKGGPKKQSSSKGKSLGRRGAPSRRGYFFSNERCNRCTPLSFQPWFGMPFKRALVTLSARG